MHNQYSYQYNKIVFEALENLKEFGNAYLFAGSVTSGCQQFPIHWGVTASITMHRWVFTFGYFGYISITEHSCYGYLEQE